MFYVLFLICETDLGGCVDHENEIFQFRDGSAGKRAVQKSNDWRSVLSLFYVGSPILIKLGEGGEVRVKNEVIRTKF